MALRNIQVGDNLSGKTVFFQWPEILPSISSSSYFIVGASSSYRFYGYNNWGKLGVRLYNGSVWTYTNVTDLTSITLSDNFGQVTSIDTENPGYQYVYIDDGIGGEGTYTVTFYDDDRTTVLETSVVMPGGAATPPANPTKNSTAQYQYTFAGWDGSYTNVQSNTSVYATYTSTVRTYTIIWNVDGDTTTETYNYGDTPSFKGSTAKVSDSQYTYTFTGWSPSLTAVDSDKTYTAQYSSSVRSYTITWNVDGVTTSQAYNYGATPSYSGDTNKAENSDYTYEFIGWNPEITIVTGNKIYTAQYTAIPKVTAITAESIEPIKVYEADETVFDNNGLKILQPRKAIVYKEDNGDYYLEIEDSIENLDYYKQGYVIRVPTPWGVQGFRCANPKKKNKKLSVKAWHLFYDSARYVIEDSNVVDKTCNDALDHLNIACDQTTPFTTISDVTTISSFRCVRKSYEEAINTILERWGGHLDRDNFNIGIRETLGQDRGVTLAYGKNIQEIEAQENWDNVTTKLLPYTTDGDVAILLDDVYVSSDISYEIPYTKTVKFENDLDREDYETDEEYLTAVKEDLRSKAADYLENNKVPQVNYTLKAHLEDIADVGDTIHVKHPRCSIDIETHVISVVWDCIRKRYKEIEFGNFRNRLKNLVTDINRNVTDIVTQENTKLESRVKKELDKATASIKGAMGSSYVVYDGDKILVVDTLPVDEATNCILINNGGIGFSTTGINGTFNSAWTIDGTLDMQHINVINLVADMIKGGTLKLGSAENESGILELYDASNNLIALIDKTGITVYATDGSYVKLNPEVGFAGYDAYDNKIYWADGDVFHMKKAEVEEEITLAGEIRILSIDNGTNKGLAFVPLV